MYGYIYCIENLINGRYYIGQSINPRRRWREHINTPKEYSAIDRAIQKYGLSNFAFNIIDSAKDLKTLNDLEESYMCLFGSKTVVGGYNIRGGGSRGRLSNKTRQKIGRSRSLGLNIDQITVMYLKEGFTLSQIAKSFNCDPVTIFYYLKRNGVELRDNRNSHRGKSLFGFTGANFQKNKNPEKRCWKSKIKYCDRQQSLGLFEDPLTAEIVYELVKKEIYGYVA